MLNVRGNEIDWLELSQADRDEYTDHAEWEYDRDMGYHIMTYGDQTFFVYNVSKYQMEVNYNGNHQS